MVRQVSNIGRQAVEAGPSHFFEMLPLDAERRGFIEVHRDAKTPPDFGARAVRDVHTIDERGSFERNEGDHVGRPTRGCTPRCWVRSMSSAALPTARMAASITASAGPASVTTLR